MIYPAWLASRFPGTKIGVTTYGEKLANQLGLQSKHAFETAGGELTSKCANEDWLATNGSQVWSKGLEGDLLGRGFDFGIVDDPTANMVKTQSLAEMENLSTLFHSAFVTRANILGKSYTPPIIIVQQRLSPNDLVGQLEVQEHSEPWHCVYFESVKTDELFSIPSHWTIEEDARQPGEWLTPEIETKASGERLRNPVKFYSQYQQRPIPNAELSLNASSFVITSDIPIFTRTIRAWDTANSKTGDYTVGVKVGFDEQENLYILDLIRVKLDSPEVYNLIVETALKDGIETVTVVEESSNSKTLCLNLQADKVFKHLREFKTVNISVTKGNLTSRIEYFKQLCYSKKVLIRQALWNKDLINELLAFRGSKNDTDDQIAAICTATDHYIQTLKRGFSSLKVEEEIDPFSNEGLRKWAGHSNSTQKPYYQKKRYDLTRYR